MRPLTELFRERGCAAAGICGGFNSPGLSSSSPEIPNSRARYAGAREPRGVRGETGLFERSGRCGDEKVRIGRGRTGVCTVKSDVELESDEEDMTDAFLLRSARLGSPPWLLLLSGVGEVTWTSSMLLTWQRSEFDTSATLQTASSKKLKRVREGKEKRINQE